MKIKLSKVEWESAGKKAGWIKESQSDEIYPKKCPECKGNKYVHKKLQNPKSKDTVEHVLTCDTCSGKGYISKEDVEAYRHRAGITPCPWGNDCPH
jgi:DnaJ-class molecular chaperone